MYIVLFYYQQLSVLKIYGHVPWWLTTVSAFQFQICFRGSGLIWKINCSWKPGTAYSSTDQPGALLQLLTSFSGTAAGEVEWGVGERGEEETLGVKVENQNIPVRLPLCALTSPLCWAGSNLYDFCVFSWLGTPLLEKIPPLGTVSQGW